MIVVFWLSFDFRIFDIFRSTLWVNQFSYLFLAPFLVYVGLEAFRRYRIKQNPSKLTSITVGIVFGIAVGMILIDSAFFMGGIDLIIPEQHPETQKNPIEFEKLEKTMKFGESFWAPLVNVAHLRARKKLVDRGYIELGNDFGKKTKIISIGIGFMITLSWVIYYNNVNSFWNASFG